MQKYDLAVLNRGEHFHSPQDDENAVHFCGDFFNEKRKRLKAVRRQAKIGPGYLQVISKYVEFVPEPVEFVSKLIKVCCTFHPASLCAGATPVSSFGKRPTAKWDAGMA